MVHSILRIRSGRGEMARAPLTTGIPNSGDGILADLRREPFRLRVPPEQTTPFIFASPHSGRAYPAQFRVPEPSLVQRAQALRGRVRRGIVPGGRRLRRAFDRRVVSARLSGRQSRTPGVRRRDVRGAAPFCGGCGKSARQCRPGGHSPHRPRGRRDLSPQTRRGRSQRPARDLLPTLPCRARATCGRDQGAASGRPS